MALTIKKTRGRGNSDPTPIAQVRIKRPRTNSLEAALYDHDYSDYARATFHSEKRTQKPWTLDPPPPLFDHREWTDDIIRHMYDYSKWRLKLRRVSPRSLPFLETLRDTAQKALETPTVELKIQLAAWNHTLHSGTMLRKEPSFAEKEGYKAIVELTIYRYLSDYGDYLGEHCVELRKKATALKNNIPEVSLFIEGKNWTDVQQVLDNEEHQMKEWQINRYNPSKTYNYPDIPMTSAIRTACHEAQINHTNALISHYIKEGLFEKLALQIDRDIKDVPYVFGKKERDQMLAVLKYIRDLFFDDIKDPESPILSEEAMRRLAEKREKRRRAQSNERREEEARIRRENQVKREKDDDDDEEVKAKRQSRSEEKVACEDIGGFFGFGSDGSEGSEGSEGSVGKEEDIQTSGLPVRSLPSE
ncbi:hypothetical protein G7Y79_00024g054900 [Physcia stellaris]|nr:hypothetical protein G7Y79_00024g054900 [Physcia stellaris]